MSIHDGHRQRLKARFRREGLDHFEQINALELLLFYCVPRQDTNPLAHRLLDEFGSFNAVLDASPEALEKVEGVGSNVSTFLHLLQSTWRYYQVRQVQKEDVLTTMEQCRKYLEPYFLGRREELVYLLCLDARSKVICCRQVGEGDAHCVSISIRRIVQEVINANASSVVLAHNHPHGDPRASTEDVSTTNHLASTLAAMDVYLLDHIIVTERGSYSMVQSGDYRPNQLESLY